MLPTERLREKVEDRRKRGLYRSLRIPDAACVDFSSNDYLGVCHRKRLSEWIGRTPVRSGATGSRLLSGDSVEARELENLASEFHKAPAALLFNSGYDANLGFFSCVPDFDDVVVYDELIHASVIDGIRLGRAKERVRSFEHNSVRKLQDTIRRVLNDKSNWVTSQPKRVIFVAIESVYSMDGGIAPLKEILQLAEEMSTSDTSIVVVVDEAHAVGLVGRHGAGAVVAAGLEKHAYLFARIVTFGKAFGAHGAMVLGAPVLREYLINYSRPLIYSTALPPHSVGVLKAAYMYARSEDAAQTRQRLARRIAFFRRAAWTKLPSGALLDGGDTSAIQGVVVPGNKEVVAVSQSVRSAGFEVYPIRSPTVPKGKERIRIIIHAHNTERQITDLVEALVRGIRADGKKWPLPKL